MVVKLFIGINMSCNFKKTSYTCLLRLAVDAFDACFGDIAESGQQAQMQDFEIPAGCKVNLRFFSWVGELGIITALTGL